MVKIMSFIKFLWLVISEYERLYNHPTPVRSFKVIDIDLLIFSERGRLRFSGDGSKMTGAFLVILFLGNKLV